MNDTDKAKLAAKACKEVGKCLCEKAGLTFELYCADYRDGVKAMLSRGFAEKMAARDNRIRSQKD